MRIAVGVLVAGLLCAGRAGAAEAVEWMVELRLDGRQIEGTPLAWSRQRVHMLGRDGWLWEFDPDRATDYHKTSSRFRPYAPSEFRAELLRDLGKGFEVSGTGHYLVAHPRGQRDKWAGRFEELYRSFVHYFSVRGFKLKKPPLSLIGIVCRNQREFAQYSMDNGMSVSSGILGYYSAESNRITVYDMHDRHDLDDWHRTASVIIHEATHQTAFNTGVHSRFTRPPLWVVEGLATMFEAPGVHDSRHHTRRRDRINRGRLADFRRLVPRHRAELLRSIVATDDLFRVNPGAAYAEAWALTFYLAETQPGRWARYVARTAAYPPFTEVIAGQRVALMGIGSGLNCTMAEVVW